MMLSTGCRVPCAAKHLEEVTMPEPKVVEICTGAGGQSLGLELAGFEHELCGRTGPERVRHPPAQPAALEGRPGGCRQPGGLVSGRLRGTDLLAGGVPCPPFTVAGKQLGATDERDLFAWDHRTVRGRQARGRCCWKTCGGFRCRGSRRTGRRVRPARGTRLRGRLAAAARLGLRGAPTAPDSFSSPCGRRISRIFSWPEPAGQSPTVGEMLRDLMAARGWPGASAWAERANDIAPTIVGGSKKHGGADLGPTRAKRAWREMGVDALGVADAAPWRTTPRPCCRN